MTKAEIAAKVAEATGLDKKVASTAIDEVMKVVKESLINGENVYLRGFGTFEVKQRASKTARNITAGTTIVIPARKVATFKPGKDFVEQMSK